MSGQTFNVVIGNCEVTYGLARGERLGRGRTGKAAG
jgi:hypothetical protein